MAAPQAYEEREYDFVVIGAGLAGICAAIAASRLGLKVALVNDRPVLGGNSSTEIRVHVGGADHDFRWSRETGILEEIRIEDRFRNHAPIVSGAINQTWNAVLWEWVTREKGLDLYLNTCARRAVTDGADRLLGAVCEQLGTERTFVLLGDYFADCSGDGQLAYSAGADFRMGREPKGEYGEDIAPEVADKKTLGSSILFRAIDVGHPVKFVRPDWAYEYPTEQDLPFRNHERVTSGYWWIELGGENDTIKDNEEIRDELWKSLYGVWDHIKNKGDHGAENLALDWVGAVPGKRESRRFLGDYVLTQRDVESEARFPDGVAYGGWPIDLHPAGGIRHPGPPAEMKRLPGPYAIPFRCLYSRNVKNLMMAGRNISASHVAFGTIRLQATGAVEGQAIGTAAYLCKKLGVTPRSLCESHIRELQQLLIKEDCYIPSVINEDALDQAKRGRASASSEMQLEVTELDSFIPVNEQLGQVFPMTESRLDQVHLYLRSPGDCQATLKIRNIAHWRDRSGLDDLAVTTAEVPGGEGWVAFEADCELATRFCWILLDPAPGLEWGMSREEPVGVQRTELGPWRRLGGSYLFRTQPASCPYGPDNLLSGATRPESWTNIWISDPKSLLPQSATIELQHPIDLKEVRLTFDSDIDDLPSVGPSDKCVKSYTVSCRVGSRWSQVVRIDDNHHRVRVHRFDGVPAEAIKIEVLRTWGSPSARMYEVRAYGD